MTLPRTLSQVLALYLDRGGRDGESEIHNPQFPFLSSRHDNTDGFGNICYVDHAIVIYIGIFETKGLWV